MSNFWRHWILGQPEPSVPERDTGPSRPPKCKRDGFVSLWTGNFASVADAEAYFGIPDEIGVSLPAEAFAADFALGDFPQEFLEVNFEQVEPRPLQDLLWDATYSVSFLDQAVLAAARQGVEKAQGIALLFDFDYRLNTERRDAAGVLRFIGVFPYVQVAKRDKLQPLLDIAREIGCPDGAMLFVFLAFAAARTKLEEVRGATGHITAKQFCEQLLRSRGDDTPVILREFGLRRSEDVGRIVFALVNKGMLRVSEGELEGDFAGLFNLG
jgi:uncharacterized repeat protein (TIGR04138 family)